MAYRSQYFQENHLYPYEAVTSVAGKYLLTKVANVNVRKSYGTKSDVIKTIPTSGTCAGKAQGRIWYDTGETGPMWYEMEGGGFIRDDLATPSSAMPKAAASPLPIESSEASQGTSKLLMYALAGIAALFVVPKLFNSMFNK
jgi:hypothetical protein